MDSSRIGPRSGRYDPGNASLDAPPANAVSPQSGEQGPHGQFAGLTPAPRRLSRDSLNVRHDLVGEYPVNRVTRMINHLRTPAGQQEAAREGVTSWLRLNPLPVGIDAAPYTPHDVVRVEDLGSAAGEATPVGPVMLANVKSYDDGSKMGQIDVHDEDAKNELISFLFDVEMEDPTALSDRFEKDYHPDAFEPAVYGGMVVAVKDDMIAGFMDFSPAEQHDPQLVAQINILVAKQHQGTGVARNLAKQVDDVLIAKGYRYKFSYVWESNTPQLERMETRGWRLDPTLTEAGKTRAFWIALDPRYRDIPPPRSR